MESQRVRHDGGDLACMHIIIIDGDRKIQVQPYLNIKKFFLLNIELQLCHCKSLPETLPMYNLGLEY